MITKKEAKYNLREQLPTEREIESLLLEGDCKGGSKEEASEAEKRRGSYCLQSAVTPPPPFCI